MNRNYNSYCIYYTVIKSSYAYNNSLVFLTERKEATHA